MKIINQYITDIKKGMISALLIGLSIFTVSLTSCKKFLEVELDKSQTATTFVFSNDVTATSAVTGIYDVLSSDPASFASGATESILMTAGLSSDELVNYPQDNANYIQFENNSLLPANSILYNQWKSMYKSIYQANAVLKGLSNSSSVSFSVKKQLEGEARFIRAFCNFYLINTYGDVPLILTTDYQENSLAPRTPVITVYDQIKNDLLSAEELLSEEYPQLDNDFFTPSRVRPNKATSRALLARVYLYNEEWLLAEEKASEIITDNLRYELVSDLTMVFLANSREAIWQLRPVSQTGEGVTGEAVLFSPTSVGGLNSLRSDFVNVFDSGDARRLNWVGGSGTLYYPTKYMQNTPVNPPTEYSMIFRLAEQYLIRAEARAKQNKLTGVNSAEADINVIRNRAGLGNTSAVTQSELLSAIEQERRVELFTEWGHRWYDLKRWDRATAVLGPVKTGWTANDMLYPLPQFEMNKNPNLIPQNMGY